MPVYDYRCALCGTLAQQRRSIHDNGPLPQCPTCRAPMTRDYSLGFGVITPMQPHFNLSVGHYVTNKRQFTDSLKAASDEASERLGHEHRFVEIDPTDTSSLGVTEDGMDETYRRRRNSGQDEGRVWL